MNYRLMLTGLSFFVWLCAGTIHSSSPNYALTVFNTPALRTQFTGFIDGVLKIVRSDDFYRLIDDIQKKSTITSDHDLYRELSARGGSIKKGISILEKRKALTNQKKVLSAGIKKLLGSYNAHGCIEIGTPGTYISSMKNFLVCKKPFYVINDKQRITDVFSTLSLRPLVGPKPYDTFIPLHDYAPISPKSIPDNSVDIIICMPGLHHAHVTELPAFIASLYRVVRPGGYVIIREHDAHDDNVMALIYTAHTVFNALFAQENLDDEIKEYRNFQPLTYWINAFEKQGFSYKESLRAQKKDPTLNTLLLFEKPSEVFPAECSDLFRFARHDPHYIRPLAQSYQTSPEWANVFISQEYAQFQKNHPFYTFPYMKSFIVYWKVFKKSLQIAQREQGIKETIFSQYTLMDLFIGFSMTIEYMYRSLFSLPLRLTKAELESNIKQAFHAISADYGDFITHTPFYEYPFFASIKKYWSAFSQTKKKNILHVVQNIYIGLALSLEMGLKGLLSAPLAWTLSGVEASTIGMIVDDPTSYVTTLSNVTVKKEYNHCRLIDVPRYASFTPLLEDMINHGITIYEIAGQKSIQLTVTAKKPVVLTSVPHTTIEYQWKIPSQPTITYYALTASIRELKHILHYLRDHDARVLYIHDF